MKKLQISVGNVKFINPFVLASAPPTRNGEMIARAFEQGWAGAVTKTICLNYKEMIDVSPRIIKLGNGLQNVELISPRSIDEWIEDIKFLKTNYPDNVVIASIAAEAGNAEDWQKLTQITQEAGADAVELNFSCPHGLPEKGMGNTCSDIPEIAGFITKSVKEVAKIPVWVKLSPNVTNIKDLAKSCLNNGADVITAINTVKGFAGIDIETGKPKLDINGYSTYGGFSGGMIKPIALKAVSEISSSFNCAVSATGGISTWQDSVEFMLLGASTLQICTEVMFSGYEIINNLKKGLYNYLEKNEYDSLSQIIGNSLKYIKPHSCLQSEGLTIPEINQENCIKCGKCFLACKDGAHQAIEYSKGVYPQINTDKCSGCALCKTLCPVNSIKMGAKEKNSV